MAKYTYTLNITAEQMELIKNGVETYLMDYPENATAENEHFVYMLNSIMFCKNRHDPKIEKLKGGEKE